ncbi:hypothetical protein PHLGIDRAFT_116561 [Phlebiopsis gigantea 11061_1 CR5-6]|uniref:Peptidase S8/S53 domain-containing protein n=1 Tax=Phlebiopsis gigantea (strain 11061_1 CR5-6) TaxID=745531 RepID=A0A0C3SCV6_PHLG1|nr:hypothetical protein PHLGIDRAFT_116561 [Phlebiopsis gigantea 11061_1 CR5-6]
MAEYYYVVFTPTCTKEAPATAKTCNDLATEWQLAVSDFVELNDNVDSTCDNLVVGQEWDANQTTPARAKGANTVSSSTIADARSSTSNYGSVLKLFAPGRQINVADYSSDVAYTVKSGTSFASPHVAGLVAYLISLYGNKTPKEMTDYLQATVIEDVLSDILELFVSR